MDKKMYFRYEVDGIDVLKPNKYRVTSCCFEFENTTKLIWCQLYIQSKYRRKGYGRLLLALVKTAAKVCGITEIAIKEPIPTSKAVKNFLETTGFKKNVMKSYVCALTDM